MLAASDALGIYGVPSSDTVLFATFQPSTSTMGRVKYYVAQAVSSCESECEAMTGSIKALPISSMLTPFRVLHANDHAYRAADLAASHLCTSAQRSVACAPEGE
jgi:hypothetical protein